MNRSLLSGTCAAALLACSAPALAEGVYVGVAGGWNALKLSNDLPSDLGPVVGFNSGSGWAASALVGFLMGPGFRLEAEAGWRNGSFSQMVDTEGLVTGSANMFAFMANGWYDFNGMGAFRPYVGGGLGLAVVQPSLNDPNTSVTVGGSQTVFAYQLGAGIGYALGNNVTLSFDYRFLGTGDLSIRTNVGAEQGFVGPVNTHSVMVGARFNFGPHSLGVR